MKKTAKARLNLTIDPDIYAKARRVFDATDMSMSAFMEIHLAKFLQTIDPLMPLLEQAEQSVGDPADAKAAIRVWFAHSIGQPLSDTYHLSGENILEPLTTSKVPSDA